MDIDMWKMERKSRRILGWKARFNLLYSGGLKKIIRLIERKSIAMVPPSKWKAIYLGLLISRIKQNGCSVV